MQLPPLYAIVDAQTAVAHGWTIVDLAAAYLAGGARWIQFRGGDTSTGALLRGCDQIVERAARYGATVIVNDRADVARLAGADGVHVGQQDLPVATIRRQFGPDGFIGLSTHTAAEIAAAQSQEPDYVAVGPVYSTATKATGYAATGLTAVRGAVSSGRPVVAIGGITLERAPAVLDAGASSVAVISDLVCHGDPERRVRAYVDALRPRDDPK